jgi:5-methyltetrahydrofolate--homocysteine methyltransferase
MNKQFRNSPRLSPKPFQLIAESLHRKVRRFMGFGIGGNLSVAEMIAEKYRGIRPAAGYLGCPDHTEKQILWDLLDMEKKVEMELSSSYAMFPGRV